MTCLSNFPCATLALKIVALSFGLSFGSYGYAQTTDIDQLGLAREAIAKQDWRTAEALLLPLSQKQSQSQNPFVFYELAQVYENTRRPEAAKKIYQELTTSPDLVKRQPTIVIRAPYASRLLSLISLSQSKLNAIEAKQLAALPPPEPIAPKTAPAAIPEAAPPKTIATSNPAVVSPSPQPAPQQEVNAVVAVSIALKNWADAWTRKDLPKYFSSYTENYRGQLPTQESWKKQRQANISKPKSIQLDIRNVAMTTLSPSSVQVQFQQIYMSDLFKETTNKTLMFASISGQWLIESETTK